MKIEYICPLITVNDILKSKEFYMNILKQEVELDHGENIAFKSGLAIHDKNHFQKLTGKQIEGEAGTIWNYIFSQTILIIRRSIGVF